MRSERLSNYESVARIKILKELIPHNDTHCDSTEDLLAEVERINNSNNVNSRWKIGSLDIEALYPSLDIPKCAEVITQMMYESEIQIKNVQWKEVMLYIRFMWTDDQIRDTDLWEYAPSRRTRRGRPPTFVSSGSELHAEDRFNPWIFDEVTPDEDTIKRMFSIAIGIMVIETITNHGYQYNSKIFKQEEGGAIGLELVGVVAKIYMCWWDKQLLQRAEAENLKLELYKRYEDDCNVAVDDFREDTTDEEVMKKLSQIADTIDSSIKSTYDYGSKYEDGRSPMLDLRMWIGEDSTGTTRVMHAHYMKDVSSRYLMHARSSHPNVMKVNVLVNEGLRILRNTSVYLGWNEARTHLQHFVKRMQFSGYDKAMRAKVLQKILRKHDEKMQTYAETNKRYRSREEQYDERRKVKEAKKSGWYDKERYDGVLFVDVTEDGDMMREILRSCKRNKMKVKVIEKMRSTVKDELQRSNPFKIGKCGRESCVLCRMNTGVDCRTRGCVYQMRCKECSRKYRGQTGRSTYERMNEHFTDYTEKKEGSVLFEHSK